MINRVDLQNMCVCVFLVERLLRVCQNEVTRKSSGSEVIDLVEC